MKHPWLFILIACIALVVVSAFQYFSRPGEGDIAPAFFLSALNGNSISFNELKGRPVIVHFWALWCGICRSEFPAITEFFDRHRDDIAFLVVSEDGEGDERRVRQFMYSAGVSFPVMLDFENKMADDYASFGVPETVFIGRDGRIVWRHSGFIDWQDRNIEERIKSFLALDRNATTETRKNGDAE